MPGEPRPTAPRWPLWAWSAVAVASLAAAVGGAVNAMTAATTVVLAAMACSSVGHPARLAWWWGFLLPVDLVGGAIEYTISGDEVRVGQVVPTLLLDVARYGGLLWLCLVLVPDLSPKRRTDVLRMAGLAAAVGAIRLTASTLRWDRAGILVAGVMVVGALTAPFLAVRVRAHLAVLSGFVGGMALSSLVSVMQALELPTLIEGNQEGSRFPGLSASTSLFSWLISLGIITAVAFAVTPRWGRFHRGVALVSLPLTVAALVVNGAQGGLLGLAVAALAVAVFGWRSIPRQTLVRAGIGIVAALAVLVGLVVATGIRTPTLDGAFGSGNYSNEKLRVEVAEEGWKEMVANPLTGVGRSDFIERHDIAPHNLPLEAGITAGVLGFVTALALLGMLLWVVVRGPVGRRPEAFLGVALCAAMFANTLSEMGGPFTGLPRFALTLLAVVACRGEPWPLDRDPAPEPVAATRGT